nr:retrovirus-related Pol polyprotein from transposon TNT 1-94 [Tanacetum cinerariifolium]
MIPKPGDQNHEVPVNEISREQTDDELAEKELKQIEANDQAIQIILLGLPEDIYAAVDSCETAQEIWFTSTDGELIESYYHHFSKLMNEFKRNKHFPKKIASNLKFLNNLQPEWTRHVTIVNQTKDLRTSDYTQLYDFLKYNQKEVDDLRAERLAKTHDPLELIENSNNPFNYPVFHQDQPSSSTYLQQPLPNNNNYNPQPSFNQNYMQQPMPNPKDITNLITAINMALVLMAKAFKLNYLKPTNNNHRISSNLRNKQIAQPGINMGQDRQMQMVGGNVRAEGNAIRNNGNKIRCYICRGLVDLDEIKEVNANCILMANLQQASTSGTQTDKALVYDSDGSVEVFEQKNTTKGTSVNTQFCKQSILGKPPSSRGSKLYAVTPFPKSKGLPKIDETHALAKPVTSNSVPTLQELKVMKNDNVIAPGMFRINPFKLSREEKFVPNKVRARVENTAKTRRPLPRSNIKNDRVSSASKSIFNKNKEVENDKSEVVCSMCKQCLINANHDVCVLNYVNDMNSRGKKLKANVSKTKTQKKQKPKVMKPKKVGSNEILASPKPSKPRYCLRWSPTGRIFDLKGKIIASIEFESQSDCSNDDNACNSNPPEPTIKWFPNSTSFLGRVYFIEGLRHNLFLVGQFCDSNLEKPNNSFLHVFEALCYPNNDREDIGKLGAKAMYDDYIGGQPSAAPRTTAAAQAPLVHQTPTTSTTIADTAPTPTNSSSQATNILDTSQDHKGFIDANHPSHVYKLKKALYGLKQAPRAWSILMILSSVLLTLDADYAGCKDTFKSTSGGAQFLGEKLTQLTDYGFLFNKIPIYCDFKSAIAISCNPVQHSRTKHIASRYHFIKEHVEKGTIELYFVKRDYQLADLFTKALPVDRFNYLVRHLGMRSLSPRELERLAKSQ